METYVPFVLFMNTLHRQQCRKDWKCFCGCTAIHSLHCYCTHVATNSRKHIQVLMSNAKCFCHIFTKFEIIWQIVVEVLSIKCNKNPSSGSCIDTCCRQKGRWHFSWLTQTRLEILTLIDDFVSPCCRKRRKHA